MDTIAFDTPTLDERGEIVSWRHCSAQEFAENLGADVKLDMVLVAGGIFQMGSLPHRGNMDEHPLHVVTVKPFMIGKNLVTQEQWKAVMRGRPLCRFKGDMLPVERVSWEEARRFCRQLSKLTGRNYGFPSEAQWEYACRAGTNTPFSFGETLTTEVANYVGEHIYRQEPRGPYRHRTTEGGTFPANAFGLHDMHGNLWEWCADNWLDDYASAPRDGSPYLKRDNPYRVARGGSWHEPPENCRSATRLRVLESDADEFIGFRVCVV